MRHRVAHRKLGRVTEHRIAMLRNQATALLRHEHLETTVARAKELRPFVERIITIAKRGLAKGSADSHVLNARRMVGRDLQDREVVTKLFDTLAPRFAERPGGYTRLLRLGFRKGDSAEVAQVELIGSEFDPSAKADTETQDEGQGRRRAAPGGRGSHAREGRRSRRRRQEAFDEAVEGR